MVVTRAQNKAARRNAATTAAAATKLQGYGEARKHHAEVFAEAKWMRDHSREALESGYQTVYKSPLWITDAHGKNFYSGEGFLVREVATPFDPLIKQKTKRAYLINKGIVPFHEARSASLNKPSNAAVSAAVVLAQSALGKQTKARRRRAKRTTRRKRR